MRMVNFTATVGVGPGSIGHKLAESGECSAIALSLLARALVGSIEEPVFTRFVRRAPDIDKIALKALAGLILKGCE